jgi:hypothetical protein
MLQRGVAPEQVPHDPPQPSSPQARPVQFRVHELTQVPVAVLHACPEGQLPQEPPQPLLPQVFPVQRGSQMQVDPSAAHSCPNGQVPQVPPHPSWPQSFCAQLP